MAGTENVYDYPQYFDLLFREETTSEANFIEAACRKYARQPVRRLCEPGCGGGRLIVELARRGYDMVGFDCSQPAIRFLRQRLHRNRLTADVGLGDLEHFRLQRPVDAAFCTFNTFRHLLTEQAAANHLNSVAAAVRRGGIYILGFHLLPLDVDEGCIERWSAKQGAKRVTVTLRVLETDRRRRLEQIRLSMLVRGQGGDRRWRTEFPLRMYTAGQFRRLLRRIPQWELCDVYDFWYEIDEPLRFDEEITDTVFILRKK